MRQAPLLSLFLATSLASAAPALAADAPAPVGVLAPEPTPRWDAAGWARDAGVATVASGAVLGLAWLDGGRGALSGLGAVGQLALIGAAGALPPAAMIAAGPGTFRLDDYMAGLSGGLVGLGIGYLLTAGLGGSAPTSLDAGIKAAAMAVGQGLGSATGYQVFQAYRPTATDLDRLPAHRTDDPIDDWNLRRERNNP